MAVGSLMSPRAPSLNCVAFFTFRLLWASAVSPLPQAAQSPVQARLERRGSPDCWWTCKVPAALRFAGRTGISYPSLPSSPPRSPAAAPLTLPPQRCPGLFWDLCDTSGNTEAPGEGPTLSTAVAGGGGAVLCRRVCVC